MVDNPPFRVTSSQTVWSCRWYSVRQDQLLLPDGRAGEYNVVQKSEAVFVLPITPAGEVVLIYTYRHPIQAWCWEIPAGSILPGQTAEEAARMELLEEVGGTATELLYLGRFFAANGFCNEATHLFVAQGVTLGTPTHEPLELIQIHLKPWAEVLQMAHTGQIPDALSCLTILLTATASR